MTTAAKETPKKNEKAKAVVEELSEEDLALQSELDMLVQRLKESNKNLYRPALESLRTLIRTSTSSMTSVPKPLKFLRVHYGDLTNCYDKWPASDTKRFLADILALLAMSYAPEDSRDCLKFRLAGSLEEAGTWGHEFVRYLASEIIAEWASFEDESAKSTPHAKNVMKQAMEIVPFFMKHNAEADACDLLIELESLHLLPDLVERETFQRVCLYILGCVPYVTPPDDLNILKTAHAIYKKMEQYPAAIQVALKLNDLEMIKEDLLNCPNSLVQKQLAFILARQQVFFETDNEELNDILRNTKLSENFHALAKDLNVMEPKLPEDIYKRHLENVRSGATVNLDSAKQNLASTYVNAFINAGFGTDKLMLSSDDTNWIYKNKDLGMLSAAASLGSILLWDIEGGLAQIDKYLYSQETNIQAGALLAIGIVSAGVKNESDPALALLSEKVNADKEILRISSIFGLGLAYAGSAKEEIQDILLPLVTDTGVTMEISSFAALALGLVFVGTCHGEICSTILQTMMERDDSQLKDPYAVMMGLGLALLFLGRQNAAEAPLETLKVIENPLAKQIEVLVEVAAFAATGNVLLVQKMLHLCNDHLDPEKEVDTFQAFAVLGIALIAMGEEIGTEMSIRSFNHLMHYGEPVIRKTVPLALGLLCSSNPLVNILDLLSKYSHDNDKDVSINAIFAMGLIGAGTNNARLAQMLRQLAAYYYKEADHLFVVRIAQGLVHMGKGTLTLNPFNNNRQLMSLPGLSGLLVVLVGMLDSKTFLFGKSHYILYALSLSMYPRFLMTLDTNLKPVSISCRVGQAVDVVGQAGRPKTITGFQTQSTPVLLGYTERAELANEEYKSLCNVLEGFVIVEKNPDWMDEDEAK